MATFQIGPQAPALPTQQTVGVEVGQLGLRATPFEAPKPNPGVIVERNTLSDVMNIAGAILQPLVAQRQKEDFLLGAQRVQQGEAVKDIIDNEPWYTKIFGPSATVQGARKMSLLKNQEEFLTGLHNDMPQLQQLSPEQFGEEVRKRQLSSLTGDAEVDDTLLFKMAEASGPLYNQQAKLHYKWTQDTMQQQYEDTLRNGASRIQAAFRNGGGTLDEDAVRQLQLSGTQLLPPLAGQSMESYFKGLENATMTAMAEGNHHFASIVFSSGILDHAPADTVQKLLDAREKYERRTMEQEGFLAYGAQIAELKIGASQGLLSPKQIGEAAVAMNAKFRLETGVNRDMLDRGDFVSLLTTNGQAMYARQRENVINAEKKEYQDRLASERMVMINSGQAGILLASGHPKKDVDSTFWGAMVAKDAAGQDGAELAVNNFNSSGYVNDIYKQHLQTGMRAAIGAGYGTPAFNKTYEQFRRLAATPAGLATAIAYLGDDGMKMQNYDTMIQNGVAPEQAGEVAFSTPVKQLRKTPDKEIIAQVEKAVSTDDTGWWGNVVRGDYSRSSSTNSLIANTVGVWKDRFEQTMNMQPEAATALAMKMAKSQLDVVGPYAYSKRIGDKTLAAYVAAPEDKAGKLFAEEVYNKAVAAGLQNMPKLDASGRVKAALPFGLGLWNAPIESARALQSALAGDETMVASLSSGWDRVFGDQPDVSVIPQEPKIDESGLPYRTFVVSITTKEGEMRTITVDSRDLRKQYESGIR